MFIQFMKATKITNVNLVIKATPSQTEPLLSITQESNCVYLIGISRRLKEVRDMFWPVQNLSPWLCLHQHFSAQERAVQKLTISLQNISALQNISDCQNISALFSQ